jgi:hypothetical protein
METRQFDENRIFIQLQVCSPNIQNERSASKQDKPIQLGYQVPLQY